MLGVHDVDVAWTTGNKVSHVVEDSCARAIAKTGLVADGTRSMLEVTTTPNDLGLGQIFGARNALRDIRQILSGT
jgi:hypothetical protein